MTKGPVPVWNRALRTDEPVPGPGDESPSRNYAVEVDCWSEAWVRTSLDIAIMASTAI